MNLDAVLSYAGTAAEAAVVGLLFYRRAWRTLPFFCAYSVWVTLGGIAAYPILHWFPASYLATYLIETGADSALQLCVLVELTWSVLRPIRASLPRSALVAIVVLLVAVGAAVWPFSSIHGLGSLPPAWRNLVHVQQTASVLRVLFFLVLAGCSQLLSIGWRDRELQVATGLGFYSIVSLAVDILHSHQAMGPQYKRLDQFLVASYICSLLYWVFSFATKEAERRDFTPQMQNLLLAMAGAARTTRTLLADSASTKPRKPGEQ